MTMVEVDTCVDIMRGRLADNPIKDRDALMDDDVEVKQLSTYYMTIAAPIVVNNKTYDAATHIGLRPTQEDRMLLVPELRSPLVSLAAVFDGTVGPHAAHFAATHFTAHLCATPAVQALLRLTAQQQVVVETEAAAAQLATGLREAFGTLDRSLLEVCSREKLHYASSTAVVALVWQDLLTIAHVGDSRACIAKMGMDGRLRPEWLTVDHKPHQPAELRRITSRGGSLVWLHGNKPYLRGADFLMRQANGEHPKQLNYSRALGGKDLKPFGLLAEPDVNHFQLEADDCLVLLGSDGLWDVLSPQEACELAWGTHKAGQSSAAALVEHAVRRMPAAGVRDNVTALALLLDPR